MVTGGAVCDALTSPAPPCPGNPTTTSDHDFFRCLWFLSSSLLSASLFLVFLFSQLHPESMLPFCSVVDDACLGVCLLIRERSERVILNLFVKMFYLMSLFSLLFIC